MSLIWTSTLIALALAGVTVALQQVGETAAAGSPLHLESSNRRMRMHKAMAPVPVSGAAEGFSGAASSMMAAAPEMMMMDSASAPPPMTMSARAGGMSVSDAVSSMKDVAVPEGASPLSGPIILRTGSMSAEVWAVERAVELLRSAVQAAGGEVGSLNTNTDRYLVERINNARKQPGGESIPLVDGATNAFMQMRLPPAKFDSARAALRAAIVASGTGAAAGVVVSENVNAHDASSEYVDVLARERSQQKALAQLELLLKAAQTSDEALRVYNSMQTFVQQQEAAAARRKHIETAASWANFEINLQVPEPKLPPPPPPPPPPGWSPLATISKAGSALVWALALLVDVAIYALVFVLPVGAVVAGVSLLVAKTSCGARFRKAFPFASESYDGATGGAGGGGSTE